MYGPNLLISKSRVVFKAFQSIHSSMLFSSWIGACRQMINVQRNMITENLSARSEKSYSISHSSSNLNL